MVETLFLKDKNEMTLLIEDKEIPINNARFMRTMDTCADALKVTMPWFPGDDPKLDNLTAPYSYKECAFYIGGELQLVGRLYNVEHKTTNEGTQKELEIWTKTADIIDSTVIPPYEENFITLTRRCKNQCNPFGIEVVVGDGVNLKVKQRIKIAKTKLSSAEMIDLWGRIGIETDLSKIDINAYGGSKTIFITAERILSRASAKQTDKIFDHLKKLALQAGVLLSCTKYGDLLITQANIKDKPVGTIEEKAQLTSEYKFKFDGRKRFAYYKSIASSCRSSRAAAASSANDEVVNVPRRMVFRSPNNLPGEVKSAAEWKKNKSAADAMSSSFPVNTWYAPNDKLWEPNTTVTVISDTMGTKKGFTFLITKVEFKYEAGGASATLQLKPPSVYTNGVIDEPWLTSE